MHAGVRCPAPPWPGRLVLFLVEWSACRLRAHEKGYIFITLGYLVLAIALLSSRRAIAATGVSV